MSAVSTTDGWLKLNFASFKNIYKYMLFMLRVFCFLFSEGMVTKRNLEDLVLNLLRHVARAEGSYRDELIAKIVFV